MHYNGCNYLSMLGLKWIYSSKRSPRCKYSLVNTTALKLYVCENRHTIMVYITETHKQTCRLPWIGFKPYFVMRYTIWLLCYPSYLRKPTWCSVAVMILANDTRKCCDVRRTRPVAECIHQWTYERHVWVFYYQPSRMIYIHKNGTTAKQSEVKT